MTISRITHRSAQAGTDITAKFCNRIERRPLTINATPGLSSLQHVIEDERGGRPWSTLRCLVEMVHMPVVRAPSSPRCRGRAGCRALHIAYDCFAEEAEKRINFSARPPGPSGTVALVSDLFPPDYRYCLRPAPDSTCTLTAPIDGARSSSASTSAKQGRRCNSPPRTTTRSRWQLGRTARAAQRWQGWPRRSSTS